MKSVSKAIRALQLFSTDTPQISVSGVSDFLKIPKSSASRMLAAMKDAGIIEQEQNRGLYRPGALAFRLSSVCSITHSARSVIRNAMQKLAARTRHSCWVSTLSGADMVVLESVHGGYPVRFVVDIGSRLPAHLTAGGKALLARITEAEVRQIYQDHKLQTYTPRSLRTIKELLAELAIVRERRWAQTDQEVVDGIKSIGVSFCPISEPTMFALSVSFPLGNVTKTEASAVQTTLMSVAEDLGHTLGDPQWNQVRPHNGAVELAPRKPLKKPAKPRR